MKIKLLPEQSYLHECFNYDSETGELYWKERPLSHFKNMQYTNAWNVKNANKKAGVAGTRGYIAIKINGIKYRAHRIVYKMIYGTDPNHIDHINFNTSDNRIENIRNCTHTENHQHSKRQINNTTGFKGVTATKSNKFRARITVNSVRLNLGLFDTAEEAYSKYCEAAHLYFGEFLYLEDSIDNFNN
jgi:hypothetical protein